MIPFFFLRCWSVLWNSIVEAGWFVRHNRFIRFFFFFFLKRREIGGGLFNFRACMSDLRRYRLLLDCVSVRLRLFAWIFIFHFLRVFQLRYAYWKTRICRRLVPLFLLRIYNVACRFSFFTSSQTSVIFIIASWNDYFSREQPSRIWIVRLVIYFVCSSHRELYSNNTRIVKNSSENVYVFQLSMASHIHVWILKIRRENLSFKLGLKYEL